MNCPACGGELERTGPAHLPRPILTHSDGGAGKYACKKCYREFYYGWWIYPQGSEPNDKYFKEKVERELELSKSKTAVAVFKGLVIGTILGTGVSAILLVLL